MPPHLDPPPRRGEEIKWQMRITKMSTDRLAPGATTFPASPSMGEDEGGGDRHVSVAQCPPT